MQLGNGRWESTTFNSRLQPTQIALGTTPGATNLLDLDYSYGTTANNGNVISQTITVPTVGTNTAFAAVQTYNYDSLNRLKDATENITPSGGSQTQSWKQTFVFDRYGNRNFDEANTTFERFDKLCNSNTELCADLRKIMNPAISASDNRLSSGQGYSFDSSGNTTTDPQGRTFTYDGENKQVLVTDTNGTIGEYFYDGDGRRVLKHVPSTGETTVFVYDAASKLIAEYSTIVETTAPKVAYLTSDQLGSPRINTDANGTVTARHDYHPFGEEIATSQRTTGIGYAGDSVRKQFTSYERDNETDLDFAQARYYKSAHGRFSSADPLLTSATISNPQTWNRYKYALNNPLLFVDPLGLYEWAESAGGSASDEDLLARSQDKSLKKKERKLAKRQYDFRQRFTAGLQRARDASNNQSLTSAQRSDAQRAVNSYGELNDGTHDNVKVGIWGSDRANPSTDLQDDGNIYVNFNFKLSMSEKKADNFVVTVAHEGSHVADFQDWASNKSPANDISQYETERRAFMVGSYTAQSIGMESYNTTFGKDLRTWNKGWSEQQRETERANSVDRFIAAKYTAPNGQPVTKSNPGWTMSTRGTIP